MNSENLELSLNYCKKLALNHYENFFITTFFIPKNIRQDIYNIYAYCRIGDDIVDEIPDKNIALKKLDNFRKDLGRCYLEEEPRHLMFQALKTTIKKLNIPIKPFYDLIRAFEQDLTKNRYYTKEEMLDYCKYSANPVGELFLYVYNEHKNENIELSNYICTALQILNFIQDITIDLDKNRIYLPIEDFIKQGFKEEDLINKKYNNNFRNVIKDYVDFTEEYFLKGMKLSEFVKKGFSKDIKLFCITGIKLLEKIRKKNYNTILERPTLNKYDFLKSVILTI